MIKIIIIIPVYNEEKTLLTVLEKIFSLTFLQKFDFQVVCVNDASTDKSKDILDAFKLRYKNVYVIHQEKNKGKGYAIKTALSQVTGDIYIIQDADLEYDPIQYPKLLKPILDGHADVVYGSRFLGGPHRVLFYWHYLANIFLTNLSNIFTNINLSDMETCYKVFTKEAIQGIKIKSQRFGIEPELTAKFAKKKCRIYEIPISYYGRDYSEGKKIGWKDGIMAIYYIIRFNLFSRN
jgi:glycosyltransferase involved in cell wall biosynthesis